MVKITYQAKTWHVSYTHTDVLGVKENMIHSFKLNSIKCIHQQATSSCIGVNRIAEGQIKIKQAWWPRWFAWV
jgi:hypothetical protein